MKYANVEESPPASRNSHVQQHPARALSGFLPKTRSVPNLQVTILSPKETRLRYCSNDAIYIAMSNKQIRRT
ncbi:hypothetical protein AVEN_162744-1, partial [Araneus ventricosus]